jgi:hypothetical protein
MQAFLSTPGLGFLLKNKKVKTPMYEMPYNAHSREVGWGRAGGPAASLSAVSEHLLTQNKKP